VLQVDSRVPAAYASLNGQTSCANTAFRAKRINPCQSAFTGLFINLPQDFRFFHQELPDNKI